jgi:hypothetical protein
MPLAVVDYVVTHELAHLREMNHSPRFWSVVEQLCPDWRRAAANCANSARQIPQIKKENSMRILHTMIRVGDLDRSIAFYTEILGMQLLRRRTTRKAASRWPSSATARKARARCSN